MQLIDGKIISQKIYEEIRNGRKFATTALAIVLASNDEASKTYVRLKMKRAEELGIKTILKSFEENTTKEQLKSTIEELNNDAEITGVLIQLPFFPHLYKDEAEIVNTLRADKDADGLTAVNLGKSSSLLPDAILPATVDAILECLKYTDDYRNGFGNLAGKNVLIINNSVLIGKPLALILSGYDATVTIANKFTHELDEFIRKADIIVSATGQTQIIDHALVKEGVTLIDVTSEKREDKILGDFIVSPEFENKVKWFTPVPGGVGPVTIACLLRNLIKLKN